MLRGSMRWGHRHTGFPPAACAPSRWATRLLPRTGRPRRVPRRQTRPAGSRICTGRALHLLRLPYVSRYSYRYVYRYIGRFSNLSNVRRQSTGALNSMMTKDKKRQPFGAAKPHVKSQTDGRERTERLHTCFSQQERSFLINQPDLLHTQMGRISRSITTRHHCGESTVRTCV